MIFNMSGGGAGLNFKMVSSPTAPSNPSENMIWIESDVAINGWVFSATEPATVATPNIGAIASSAGTVLGTINGRTYTKKNDGEVIYAFSYNGTYTGPLVVSTDANAIIYTASSVIKDIGAEGSVECNGKTYYYTGGAWMSGDYRSSTSPVVPGTKSNADAALVLAKAYEKYLRERDVDPEGMVWATYSTSGPSSFNALKKNGIIICPLKASQYVGGEWVNKTAKTYRNDEWVDWIVYVFINGDQCIDLTGGWEATARNWYDYGQVMPTVTFEGGTMTVSSYYEVASNYYGGTVQTKNKIDMTPYSAVVFNVLDYGLLDRKPEYGTNDKYRIGVTSDTTSATYVMDAYVDVTETGMISVDVSNVNKECAIALNPASTGQAKTTAYITVDDIHFVT